MKKLLIMILLSPCLSYSATRNIVPRATSEGYIGLSTKTWAGVYADQFFGDGSSLTGLATDGELAAVAASTAPLKDYANWNTAYGWGDHAGLYLVAPASFTYQTPLVAGTDYLAPDGDGSGLSGVIQSTATGYYPLWVATATYALNGGGGGGVVDSTAVIDGLPIGSIIQYSTTTAPDGYLYCDGSYVSTTTYSDLFAVVGHRFSTYTVTGSPAVFQLPDFRGMFARGAEEDGFRVVGSTQTDTMQGHRHQYGVDGFTVGGGILASGTNWSVATSFTGGVISDITFGSVRVSTETRPENIAVAFMIKYGHVGTVAISSSSLLVGGDNTFEGANTFTGSVTVSSFTATGNVSFNIPAGSSVTWSCPTGFTAMQSQGNQLGCMQTAENGSAGHWTAMSACFTSYGGRLPFFQEIKIAFDNYALTDETDDAEWVGDIFYSNGTDHRGMQITTSGGITYELWTNSIAYRCFIPK